MSYIFLCVCVFFFVGVGVRERACARSRVSFRIQHAMRMRHIDYGPSGSTIFEIIS